MCKRRKYIFKKKEAENKLIKQCIGWGHKMEEDNDKMRALGNIGLAIAFAQQYFTREQFKNMNRLFLELRTELASKQLNEGSTK